MKNKEIKRTPVEKPVIGILAWESELEQIPGTLIHPDTFDFPVLVKRVKGACYETVVVKPSSEILAGFISAAKEVEQEGVKAIISTTGLTVLFQQPLLESVNIPVFTSSMLLIPLISKMINPQQKIGIITANTNHLTVEHFKAAGIENISVSICGIENTVGLENLAINPTPMEETNSFENEVVHLAKKLVDDNNVGAIVIEVTGLCSFSGAIRRELELPVFDIVEFTYMLHQIFVGKRWQNPQRPVIK